MIEKVIKSFALPRSRWQRETACPLLVFLGIRSRAQCPSSRRSGDLMRSDFQLNSAWSEPSGSFDQHLPADSHFNVCIIGAGIAGLSTAYRLTQEGKSVLLLDDGRPCSGQTGRTTAHLASAIDDRFTEMERLHGEEGSR